MQQWKVDWKPMKLMKFIEIQSCLDVFDLIFFQEGY